MARPLFSVVIPTIGRMTLVRTIRSVREQSVPAEVIVVFDTYQSDDAIVRATRNIAESYGARFLVLDAGRHDSGSPQIVFGSQLARGDWLLNFGDDDVYEPDAFATIAAAIEDQGSSHPLMFKTEMLANESRGGNATLLWDRPSIERFHVTGQGFVCPNDARRLGRWTNDWTFMQTTVERYDGLIDWRDEIIARCY
jgi:glycosyltransferase involved in cell wall biosynthesis